MSEEMAVADSSQEQSGFDIEQASSDLAGDLFPETRDGESSDEIHAGEQEEPPQDGADIDAAAKASSEIPNSTDDIQARPAPKTWPKEMHEHWGKVPKEVQDYWEVRERQMLDGLEQYKGDAQYGKAMRDAVTPYQALIQAQGVDAPRAVQALLNAHYKLSVSNPSQKQEYFNYLAKQYGVDLGLAQNGEPSQSIDPRMMSLQDELHQLKQIIYSGSQQQLNAERDRISKEVNTFASDPAHSYFDEVADDIVVMLKAGLPLQEAYDRAVWANPVTRAKETARIQTEAKAEADKKAREQAEAAKKAASTNIRNRDTRRTPTEQPKGTMRDLDGAMKEAMREIKARTH